MLAGLAAVILGLGSLLVARPLGFDGYAWMVWARELAHGTLQTTGGPAFKPLPVLVTAPLTPFGDLAPLAWLGAMRVAALLALLVAYRLAARIGGRTAGVTAVLLIAIGPDLVRTAAYGSSEPLLVLLVLLAAERWIAADAPGALVLLGVAGLLRPELWPIVGALALALTWTERRVRPAVWAAALGAPVVWLGMDRIGGGTAADQIHAGAGACAGCALVLAAPRALVSIERHADALGVLRRLAQSIALPALALSGFALAVPRERDVRRRLLVLGLVALAWVAIVAAMGQAGYPGARRYLVGPAAVLGVLAGIGMADLLRRVPGAPGRWAIGLVVAALIAGSGTGTITSTARLPGIARRQQRMLDGLPSAIALAGGRDVVVAAGRPAVNPWVHTALAWDLDVPLGEIQATWHSTRRHPAWAPPAMVFRGPPDIAGAAPAIGLSRPTTPVGRSGAWAVRRAASSR